MATLSYEAERRQMDTDQTTKRQLGGMVGMGAGGWRGELWGRPVEMGGPVRSVRYVSMVWLCVFSLITSEWVSLPN